MEALERSLRALGIEGAGRDFSQCKIVKQCARHRRLSNPAFVGANQNYRRFCHTSLPPVQVCLARYICPRGEQNHVEMKATVWILIFSGAGTPVRGQSAPTDR